MKKGLEWKPVFSFFCILASIFFLIALFNPKIGAIVVGFVITVLTAFAQLFELHYTGIRNYWFNKILPETHTFFIYLFITIGLMSIFYFFYNYRFSFKIERVEK